MKLYQDGVKQTTERSFAGGATGKLSNSTFTQFGAFFNGGQPWFKGIIDEVHIYDRALSAAEIQSSFEKGPEFTSNFLAKVPKGTTALFATVSWQGIGNINVMVQSPSMNYTEDIVPVYQKTTYSTSEGTSGGLNIKRLAVSINALASDQDWYIILTMSKFQDCVVTVEVQK